MYLRKCNLIFGVALQYMANKFSNYLSVHQSSYYPQVFNSIQELTLLLMVQNKLLIQLIRQSRGIMKIGRYVAKSDNQTF